MKFKPKREGERKLKPQCGVSVKDETRDMDIPNVTYHRNDYTRVTVSPHTCVGRHCSRVIRHNSRKQRHCSRVIRHNSRKQRHCSRVIRHNSRKQRYCSHMIRHNSRKQRYSSRVPRHNSRKRRHCSRVIRHNSHMQRYCSRMIHHDSRLMTMRHRHHSRCTTTSAQVTWVHADYCQP